MQMLFNLATHPPIFAERLSKGDKGSLILEKGGLKQDFRSCRLADRNYA